MIETAFIPLKSILKDIYMLLREHEVSEDLVMEFAIRGMEQLMVYRMYEKAVCFLRVENNQAPYPHGIYGIEGVLYKITDDFPKEIEVILTADLHIPSNVENGLITNAINRSYSTIKLTDFRQINILGNTGWRILPISNNTFDRSILCHPDSVSTSCGNWFIPDNSNNRFITSFPQGYLAVAYYRFPQNENGEFIIPDLAIFHEALETYVLHKIYQRLWHSSKQGAETKYKHYLEKWQQLAAAAKGDLMNLSIPEYINLSKQNKMFRDDPPGKFFGGWGRENVNFGGAERSGRIGRAF
jgi:hypothetical protein